MNYLRLDELRGYPIEKAADELDTPTEHLSYYAWPEVFGSTAGPFGGIGGQAMSTFTLEAYANDVGQAVIFCQGKRIRKVNDFRFIVSNCRV